MKPLKLSGIKKEILLCDCGCGSFLPDPPYESNGKHYASAYCLLIEAQCCSYCGGYYGQDFNPAKHEFKCQCNFGGME